MSKHLLTPAETAELEKERRAHLDAIGNELDIPRKDGEDHVEYGNRIHSELEDMIDELLQHQHDLRHLLDECER